MTHQIHLLPGQQQFTVEADETLLAAALRQGIALPYGCRNGVCGMCKGKLEQGDIRYVKPAEGLTETERQQGYILCCQAQACTDLHIQIAPVVQARQIPIRRMPARVEQVERLSRDVMRVLLKLPDSFRLQFLAGQYIDFLLKDGRHRSFSIANAPQDDNHIELHIRHVEGGRFTSEVFDHLHVNDMFRIEGPLGSFYLRDTSARPAILLAGGTGFAPTKSIIEDCIARGIPRLLYLYWGVRAREDLYMHDLALGWAKRYPNIRYIPVLSEPKPDDQWQGRTGYVHEVIAADFPDMSNYEVYGSGPPAMVYAGRDVFCKQGLPIEQYYSDAFEFAKD